MLVHLCNAQSKILLGLCHKITHALPLRHTYEYKLIFLVIGFLHIWHILSSSPHVLHTVCPHRNAMSLLRSIQIEHIIFSSISLRRRSSVESFPLAENWNSPITKPPSENIEKSTCLLIQKLYKMHLWWSFDQRNQKKTLFKVKCKLF